MKELRTFFDIVTFIPDDLKIIKASKNPLITYACEDIPIFHSINFIDKNQNINRLISLLSLLFLIRLVS